MSGFDLTLQSSVLGSLTLSFTTVGDVPLDLLPIYRGMKGEVGPIGPVGPIADVDDMPSLALIFENQLI